MMTQHDTGSGATGGGFASGVWTGITPGATGVALTEEMLRDACQAAYQDGGDPSHILSVPSVIRRLSEYLFTSSARIATLTAETNQRGPATAMGSINTFLTDFGITLDMIPNRLQQKQTTASADDSAIVFILDPEYLSLCYLKGYRTDALAKTGLAENRQMSVDWSLIVNTEKAHAMITDIDFTAAVTA